MLINKKENFKPFEVRIRVSIKTEKELAALCEAMCKYSVPIFNMLNSEELSELDVRVWTHTKQEDRKPAPVEDTEIAKKPVEVVDEPVKQRKSRVYNPEARGLRLKILKVLGDSKVWLTANQIYAMVNIKGLVIRSVSAALTWLHDEGKVLRRGGGGKSDPFAYTLSGEL